MSSWQEGLNIELELIFQLDEQDLVNRKFDKDI
jgi:hypothetical protein